MLKKCNYFKFVLLVLLLVTSSVKAGSISGKVTDSKTGSILENACIKAYHFNGTKWKSVAETCTDNTGVYTLNNLANDTYGLVFFGPENDGDNEIIIYEPEIYNNKKIASILSNLNTISGIVHFPTEENQDSSQLLEIKTIGEKFLWEEIGNYVERIDLAQDENVVNIDAQLEKLPNIDLIVKNKDGEILPAIKTVLFWKLGNSWIELPEELLNGDEEELFKGAWFSGNYKIKLIDEVNNITEYHGGATNIDDSIETVITQSKTINICFGCKSIAQPVPSLGVYATLILSFLLFIIVYLRSRKQQPFSP